MSTLKFDATNVAMTENRKAKNDFIKGSKQFKGERNFFNPLFNALKGVEGYSFLKQKAVRNELQFSILAGMKLEEVLRAINKGGLFSGHDVYTSAYKQATDLKAGKFEPEQVKKGGELMDVLKSLPNIDEGMSIEQKFDFAQKVISLVGFPETKGYNLQRELCKLGYKVELFTLIDGKATPVEVEPTKTDA